MLSGPLDKEFYAGAKGGEVVGSSPDPPQTVDPDISEMAA